MFAYYPIFEPRTSQSFFPRTRNFYQPAQHSRPCSYYHDNTSPFYNFYSPHNYSSYEDQLLREQEERERLKRFFESKEREQQTKPETSTFTTNNQPKKSFKVKIQGGDDETKSTTNKSQAAHKILNFIKNQTANKQTRKILNKLHILRIIENELEEIHKIKYLGNLTFDEEHEKQVLPISIENKRFLEHEDKIVKLLDKLDGVQSEGSDIIRERRKLLVKFAQILLGELDNEKEKQWKQWKELSENSDVVMNNALDKIDESDVAPVIEEIDVPADNQDSVEQIKQPSQPENIEIEDENITSNFVSIPKIHR